MEGRHGEEAHFMVGRKQSGAIVARDQAKVKLSRYCFQ